MPDISFTCPHCNEHLGAKSNVAGQTTKCPSCSGAFIVPVPVAIVRDNSSEKKKSKNKDDDPEKDDDEGVFEPSNFKTEVKAKNKFSFNYDLPEREPYEGKATMKQKQKLWDMGFREQLVIDDLGKRQASYLIDHLLKFHAKIRSYHSAIGFFIICVIVLLISTAFMLKFSGDKNVEPLFFQVPFYGSLFCILVSGIIILDTRHNLRK